MPATLHVVVGPVGAGKTTYARAQVVRNPGLLLDLDTWLVRLYGDDVRPTGRRLGWYLDRRERCRALLWDLAVATLDAGTDAWLELGLLTVAERAAAFERADTADLPLVIHALDAPRDTRRARVHQRNASGAPFVQIVPLEFFEAASDRWEPITADERARWTIVDA